jgi:iron complex outermembrane recepter protein
MLKQILEFQLTFTLLIFVNVYSNETIRQLKIIDKNTKDPVVAMNFNYNQQQGSSDLQGQIYLKIMDGISLKLTHVRYGDVDISAPDLKNSISIGYIELDEKIQNLQPITVLAVRPKLHEKESMQLDYQDMLSHDAGSFLNRLPLISGIKKGGSYGFDPVLRGFKYEQLNLVIDGSQSANAACPNRMDPPSSQIAMNMIEQVDIFKGPHSLRFGNSFGGTLNFKTVEPAFSQSLKTTGRLSNSYESNGGIFRTEGLVGFRKNFYDLSFFGSWSKGDDYEDGGGNSVASAFARGSAGTKIYFKLNEFQNLGISATRNFARDVKFAALPMDLTKDDTWLFNINHKAVINKGYLTSWNTNAYLTTVDHLMDNLSKHLNPRMVNAETSAKTNTFGGRTEATLHFEKSWLYAGADLRVESAEGERSRSFLMGPNVGKTVFDEVWQKSTINRAGFFGEYHYAIQNYHLVFSGRFEYNQSDASDATNNFNTLYSNISESEINPGFSVGGIYSFNDQTALSVWVGRAQRSGSLTERFINYFPVGLDPYEMVGNPELNPETNNQIDLSFDWKNNAAEIQVSVFGSYLTDYISSSIIAELTPRLPSSPGVRQFTNLDKAFLTGFELDWNQKIIGNVMHRLNLAYTYGKDLSENSPLPEIPPLDARYSVSAAFLSNSFQPEIAMRHVLKQNRVSNEYGESESGAFTLLDLIFMYKASSIINVIAGIQNLFDEAYYEHLNRSVKDATAKPIYAPGRNIFASINLNFM